LKTELLKNSEARAKYQIPFRGILLLLLLQFTGLGAGYEIES
jgi:hypothetical protein